MYVFRPDGSIAVNIDKVKFFEVDTFPSCIRFTYYDDEWTCWLYDSEEEAVAVMENVINQIKEYQNK